MGSNIGYPCPKPQRPAAGCPLEKQLCYHTWEGLLWRWSSLCGAHRWYQATSSQLPTRHLGGIESDAHYVPAMLRHVTKGLAWREAI